MNTFERLQESAEIQPNKRFEAHLPTGERLGVTRFVRRAYGRTSKPYAGLEEFAWLYEVWTPALKAPDRQWPHVRPAYRGWHTLPFGRDGEAEALRLLAGESYADVCASRPPVRGVGA